MNIGEVGYQVSTFIVYIVLFVSTIYGFYSIYYAYIKTKDEREKYIVIHSMANAFTITLIGLFVYYVIQTSVKAANVAEFTNLWVILHFESSMLSSISVLSFMIIFFGICLYKNKRKSGDK